MFLAPSLDIVVFFQVSRTPSKALFTFYPNGEFINTNDVVVYDEVRSLPNLFWDTANTTHLFTGIKTVNNLSKKVRAIWVTQKILKYKCFSDIDRYWHTFLLMWASNSCTINKLVNGDYIFIIDIKSTRDLSKGNTIPYRTFYRGSV